MKQRSQRRSDTISRGSKLRWRFTLLLLATTLAVTHWVSQSDSGRGEDSPQPVSAAANSGTAPTTNAGEVKPSADAARADKSSTAVLALQAESAPTVLWIPVPLPITGSVDTSVTQLIDRGLARLSPDAARPLLVLEFRGKPMPTANNADSPQPAVDEASAAGGTSQFERSLALARFLTGDRLRNARTVAFVSGSVTGHSVLPVLACEEIVAAPDAILGDAGAGENFIDPTLRRGYEEIAGRRRTIPVPVVLGMLDPQLAVYRVKVGAEPRYVFAQELEQLRKEGAVSEIETVKREGEPGRFTGRDLRLKYGFASHEAQDRRSLARALRVPVQTLESDPSLRDGWRPLRVDLRGPINARQLAWIRKSLETRLSRGDRNLVWLWIESPGGAMVESLGFASFLSELSDEVRTVAFVPSEARGDAALIALACDHLVVGPNAVLGGPGAEQESPEVLAEIRGPLERIAQAQHRPWSWSAALVDPRVELFEYRRRDGDVRRWLSVDEWKTLDDQDNWVQAAPLDLSAGISGQRAVDSEIARFVAADWEQLRQLYHFDGEPETIEPNWAYQFIESLSSPQIAGVLLFLAWFALMVEIMTPSLTGAGFISAVCFVLYFWSQFLHGTAGWLEVLLFLLGIAGLALEIFVIPGFGVFGLAGGALVIASLVLASQTFVIPQNSYQVSQLPTSLWTVVGAGAGVIVALSLLRRFLPNAPFFKQIMLEPPVSEDLAELERRETIIDRSPLLGQQGVAVTPLVPAGKARFGDQLIDVLSDGELIERGTTVEVIEALGNRVVVRQPR